jgi:hypothetical protein
MISADMRAAGTVAVGTFAAGILAAGIPAAGMRMPAGALRLCAAAFVAIIEREDKRYNRTESKRATLPMNNPGGHRMTLLLFKDAACIRKVFAGGEWFLWPAKYPNRGVLASILA